MVITPHGGFNMVVVPSLATSEAETAGLEGDLQSLGVSETGVYAMEDDEAPNLGIPYFQTNSGGH